MNLTAWLTIVGICALGAMSPGPSLAMVLKHTLAGGRRQGMIAGAVHGVGVGLYAFICLSGLAVLIVTSTTLFQLLQILGALYLLWLGIQGLRSHAKPDQPMAEVETQAAVRDGFLIVFLNPKIAVFFIALFSQVVGSETSLAARLGYAATALVLDGGWYVLVAWLFSNPRWLQHLQRKAVWLDRIFGVVLIGLAGKLAFELI
jgi:threonine/homoserine/homoserine lactone efflux protein